jgi:hypothetical protein
VQLLASLGTHAKELDAATGAARKSAKLN